MARRDVFLVLAGHSMRRILVGIEVVEFLAALYGRSTSTPDSGPPPQGTWPGTSRTTNTTNGSQPLQRNKQHR